MSHTTTIRRAAIEEELRQRLASDQTAAVQSALGAVALLCTTCGGVSSADARFCTNCGTKFNVMVVPLRPRADVRGSGA